MKVSLRWLNEYVDVSDFFNKPQKLADLLTDKGIEVESIENPAAKLNHVVVGIIVDKGQHPNAERLTLCQVSTGEGRVHQIVCGAKNHKANDKVAVALPGAILPNGTEIKPTSLRGIESQGMLCSAAELGLSKDHDGLLILTGDAVVGQPVAEHLGLDDSIFELKVTPNRADCLSHLGLAREVATLLDRALKPMNVEFKSHPDSSKKFVKVAVEDSQGCPLYCARVVRNVKVGPSPQWLKNRLEIVGSRSINNVVDITNYVMLELGQPLHAFDRSKLSGHEIIVKSALNGQMFKTLFDQELKLTSTDLTICDAQRPVALAGVIGGVNSGIDDSTTEVVVESAIFNMQRVRRSARQHGQQTDAAYRFARGVNPQITELAMNRVCQLLAQVASGEVLSEPWVVREKVEARPNIFLSAEMVSARLGYKVEPTQLEACLRQLGCRVDTVKDSVGHYRVEPPAHRPDLEMDMDLVEEYARINGYDKIPDHMPPLTSAPTPDVFVYRLEKALRKSLSHRGVYQAVNYNFISSKWQARVLGDLKRWETVGLRFPSQPVGLKNPLSEDLDVMRTDLLPGVLQNMIHNFHQGNGLGAIFEVGFAFFKQEGGYQQLHRVALCNWGSREQVWGSLGSQKQSMPKVFELKSHLTALFESFGLTTEIAPLSVAGAAPDIFHPAQVGIIYVQGLAVGAVGTLHPLFLEENKVRCDAAAAEVNLHILTSLLEKQALKFKPFSRYPVVQRDVAFVVPATFASQELVTFVKSQAPEALESVYVFDQFQGQGLQEGQKSLAVRVRLRKKDGTYTESESQDLVGRMVNAACQKFGIAVR